MSINLIVMLQCDECDELYASPNVIHDAIYEMADGDLDDSIVALYEKSIERHKFKRFGELDLCSACATRKELNEHIQSNNRNNQQY